MTNLIGISGKKGSGKSTIAKIIKWLVAENENVDLTHREVLENYKSVEWILDDNTDWEIRSFADKLKDMVCLLIGCTRGQLEDRQFKEKPLSKQWNKKHVNTEQMTPRKLLQLLGTYCGREIIHPNIWVNALFADYRSTSGKWIIDDVRFPNEYNAIKERGGIIVRVSTPSNRSDNHESEIALDNHTFDYTIHNDGVIPDLVEKVRDMLKHFKVIKP